MMYRCEDCGHLFEEGEQAVGEERHGLDTPPYEKWDGCPICKGDYEEVHQCKECDEWHAEEELYAGWCEKCLRETINYDTFFEYCEANKDEQYLDIFVMSELLGGMDCPDNVSYDFHQLMIYVYNRAVSDATIYHMLSGTPMSNKKSPADFLAACIRFVMDDDGSIGRENYADWLNKREGSK